MIHEKNDIEPYGMNEKEAKLLMSSEDVYEVLETFDTLDDAFTFIKEKYGIDGYEYAKEDASQSIKEEKEFIEYKHNKGDVDYIGYASFNVSDNIINYEKGIRNEPYFIWFPSGRVARVELY